MDTLGWIILGSVGGACLIGLLILLNFTVFAHNRAKKQVREISRRFEYLHALLFGQDSQFVKRLEIIARTNLLYVDIHMKFNKRYKDIRDKSDAIAQASINSLKDALSDHKYAELKKKFPEAKETLANYEAEVNALNNDLLAVVKPEEDCRQQSLQLKEELRKIKQDYYVKQADLTLVAASFDTVFKNLEKLFEDFEGYVESAQYDEAKAILPQISAVIKELEKVFVELPSVCISIQSVIPDKLLSLENRYEEMTAAEYPLHHLMVKGSMEEMQNELADLTKRVQNFELQGVQTEIDAILSRIEDFFVAFDKEKQARLTFEQECDGIYQKDTQIEKKYIKLCNGLPAVKKIYLITDEEQVQIDGIKNQINKAGATKRSLDTFIHSGTKQPYSLLVEKMHTLRDETDQAAVSIDDFERYLSSLKEDSEGALSAITDYYAKLKAAEKSIRDIGIESVSNRYSPAITELYGVIGEAYTTLLSLPIDVVKVDELISKLKTTGDEVLHNIAHDYQQMLLAEASILYANRDRQHLGEINTLLLQTEGLYFSGDFARSYEETVKALRRIRGQE
jgi:septation ring formation regulator EzrA